MVTYSKKRVRKRILSKRTKLSLDLVKKASDKVVSLIIEDPNYQKAKIVGIYLPIKNEIDPTSLLNDNTKVFVAPKIINGEMVFSIITKDSKIISGVFKTKEPKETNIINKIDYLIVPCVGIYKNYRLGFGGGYYDKYLSQNKVGKIVGVIYDFQETEFNYENHDEKLDYYFVG